MGHIATLDDLLDVMRRRWVLMLAVMIFGLALSIALGLGQRPVYEAREVLHILPPKVAHELAATTVDAPLSRQLPPLIREVLSDTSLAEIVTAYDLFAEDDESSMTALAERLRRAVRIESRAAEGQSGVVVAEARAAHPEVARLIAQELAHRLIRASVATRIGDARATLHFLTRAEMALRSELSVVEARFETAQARGTVPPEDIAGFMRAQRRLQDEIRLAGKRRARAQTGVDLEVERQSERLEVLEPAQRPLHPVIDIRGITIASGGALSAILACLVVLVAEGRHPVVRTAAHMYRLTGIYPIITVPSVKATGGNGWQLPQAGSADSGPPLG